MSRKMTPYADQAASSTFASKMLKIAIIHGYLSDRDYLNVSGANLTLEELETKLTPKQIIAILHNLSEGYEVSEADALQATLHNEQVSKWMPGKGHKVAKNK